MANRLTYLTEQVLLLPVDLLIYMVYLFTFL